MTVKVYGAMSELRQMKVGGPQGSATPNLICWRCDNIRSYMSIKYWYGNHGLLLVPAYQIITSLYQVNILNLKNV